MAHWKQIGWNCYRLMAPGHHKDFSNFEALFSYCRKHSLNPNQV